MLIFRADLASFTIALQAARDQVIRAANVITGETIDLVCTIGRHILGNLLPDRWLRLSPRAVKRPPSRYACKSRHIDRHTYKATISIDILTIPLSPYYAERVLRIMTEDSLGQTPLRPDGAR